MCIKKINKTLVIVVISAVIISLFSSVSIMAEEIWPSGVDTTSGSIIVMEQDSGAILYEKDIDHVYYPASITKIVTALVALENSELDEIVTFSDDAVLKNEGDASNIARESGEKMTMEECLYGMLLESANECAWAIAEHVADGDVEKFCDMMNEKAVSLGCKNTNFENPNGLFLEDHYTTAHDMALIAREVFKNEEFRTIIGTKSHTIPPTNKHADVTYLNNTHAMISNHKTDAYIYDGCLGGKTGYTDEAGHTLVTYAKKNDMTLICVVMNAEDDARYVDTINLFDYCFSNFVCYPIDETEALSSQAKTGAGKFGEAAELFSVDDDATVVLPKTASTLDAVAEVEPVNDKKNSNVIGILSFTYAGKYIGGGKLKVAEAGDFEYPFRNVDEKKGGSSSGFLQIDIHTVGLMILCLIALVIFILIIRNISPVLYKMKLNNRVKRYEKKHKLTVINRNRNRRKGNKR